MPIIRWSYKYESLGTVADWNYPILFVRVIWKRLFANVILLTLNEKGISMIVRLFTGRWNEMITTAPSVVWPTSKNPDDNSHTSSQSQCNLFYGRGVKAQHVVTLEQVIDAMFHRVCCCCGFYYGCIKTTYEYIYRAQNINLYPSVFFKLFDCRPCWVLQEYRMLGVGEWTLSHNTTKVGFSGISCLIVIMKTINVCILNNTLTFTD